MGVGPVTEIGKPGFRARTIAAALAVVASLGCAAGKTARPQATADVAGGTVDSLLSAKDPVETVETGDRSGDRLQDDGTLDDAGRAGLIDDAQSVLDTRTREPLPSPRGFFRPLSEHVSCEFEAITGTRSEARLCVSENHGFSCGVRRIDHDATGFVRYEGKGFLRRVHAGGLTMRFGDRLILGRGFGRFASSDEGTVRGAITISPSFSRWYGGSGAAAEISIGTVRLGTVLIGPPEGFERWRPNTFWGWGVLEARRSSLGVVVGRPASTGAAGADSDSGRHPGAASFHVAFRGDAFAASGELARLDGAGVYYGVRVTDRGRGRRFGYSILLFRAPHDPPVAPSGIVAAPSTDQGARIDGWTRIGGVKPSVSLVDAAWESASRRTSYRRAILRIENGGRCSVAWGLTTDITAATEARYPSALVDRSLTGSPEREWRTRATLRTGEGGHLISSMRLDYVPGMDGRGPAILLVLSTELVSTWFESRLQLAVYDLSSGRRMSLWKPGIGSFEQIGSLYANGSDFACRVGVQLAGEGRLVASYETAWPDRVSVYLGVEYGR